MKYALLSFFLFMIPSTTVFAGNTLQTAVEETVDSHTQAKKSQQIVDEYADKTKDMLHKYQTTLRKIDSLKTYNDQLEKLTAKQLETVDSLSEQINSIAETQQNIVPLLLRMIDVMEEFVSLDAPFLKEERLARIELIKNMMDRPDVSLPDKYRRIMEAYQIEMEYGRTIETMTDTIQANDTPRTVDILRIGRISIFYQTLDGRESGYWDKQDKRWKTLSEDYNRSITQGILIAKKQAPPDLIKLPIPAPEEIK